MSSSEPVLLNRDTYPFLPLRDVVLYPYMIFPVLVGREHSFRSVSLAIEGEKLLFVSAQKSSDDDDADFDSVYPAGVIARVLQVLKLPNGLLKVLIEGVKRARMRSTYETDGKVRVVEVFEIPDAMPGELQTEALVRQMDEVFTEYVQAHRSIPAEAISAYSASEDPLRKLYYAASTILVPVSLRQNILSLPDFEEQAMELIRLLRREVDVLRVEQEIDERVHAHIQKGQRKFYISEQIRILQNELGEDEVVPPEIDDLAKQIVQAQMSEEAERKAFEELDRLKRMTPLSPEATVSRSYIETLLSLPWTELTKDNTHLREAEQHLDEEHYGLKKPKERILEHIAVLALKGDARGQIICFVGPPGVGKTSLGRSIAQVLGRRFARISLGGVHDEAEIRGHRRTYIGSMPGKIIQAMRKAGSANPVILLDEIDKMTGSYQGDPASALLEVLDPEQNHSFVDHYIDVEFDLSRVLFITTANVRDHIPLPLQDRMEIIDLPGYLEPEKIQIAKRHLVEKQCEINGLRSSELRFTDGALRTIIRHYTMEAGVRNLDRNIATVCRKVARHIVSLRDDNPGKSFQKVIVTPESLEELLGVPRFKDQHRLLDYHHPGSVTGLAWTSAGGDILRVDATLMPGKEKLLLTGSLGDVMKESAQAALTYVRTRAAQLGVDPAFFHDRDIHIHIPEGAIPKDGPSAGITMTMALFSIATGKVASKAVAMTGEITINGEVLAIGGLTEKLMAARRYGIRIVLIPKDNEKDLAEVAPEITRGMTILPISEVREALPVVFRVAKRNSRA